MFEELIYFISLQITLPYFGATCCVSETACKYSTHNAYFHNTDLTGLEQSVSNITSLFRQ